MGFTKCNCNNCSNHLEFDPANAGQVITCPTCGMETTLYVPSIPLVPKVEKPPPTAIDAIECTCNNCSNHLAFDPANAGQVVNCPKCGRETKLYIPTAPATPFQNEKPPSGDAYTIALSPGVVRYLKLKDFWRADVENVINELKLLSANPDIKPAFYDGIWSKNDHEYYDRFERLPDGKPTFATGHLDIFIEDETWDVMLRVHHAFGWFLLEHKLPSHVYARFHHALNLGRRTKNLRSFCSIAFRSLFFTHSISKSLLEAAPMPQKKLQSGS